MTSHYDYDRRRHDSAADRSNSISRSPSRSPSHASRHVPTTNNNINHHSNHRAALAVPHHGERRHSSPGEYSLAKALISAAGGAAAATLIDKNLVQGHGHHRGSRGSRDDDNSNNGNGSHGHGHSHGHRADAAKDDGSNDHNHGLRRVIDLAIGGYAGLGAYNYYQGHQNRRHSKDAEHARSGADGLLPHAPRRHHSHDHRASDGARRGLDSDGDDSESDSGAGRRRIRSHSRSRSRPHSPVRGYIEGHPRQGSRDEYYNDRRHSGGDYSGR